MRLRLAEGFQVRTGRRTRFNVARVRSEHFPEIPDQIVRRNVDAIRALAMHKHNARRGATRAVANPGNDTGSHGVSDPPDRRGAVASARARVAHAMVSYSDRDIGTSGRQRAPPIWRGVGALRVEIVRDESITAIGAEVGTRVLWI